MTPEQEQSEMLDVLFNNPKSFVKGTRIFVADEFFALRLDVGTQQFNFALPPRVAKILSHFLGEQVKNYEAHVRKIDVDLPPPTPEVMNEVAPFGYDTKGQSGSDTPQIADGAAKPPHELK